MTAFLQTAEGDLALTSGTTPGRLTLIDGAAEKAQKIANVLGLAQGEWFLDQRQGMPYFQSILGSKNPDLEIVKRLFRRAILSVEGIEDVIEVVATLNRTTRELDYSWVAIDDTGTRISGGLGQPFIIGSGQA